MEDRIFEEINQRLEILKEICQKQKKTDVYINFLYHLTDIIGEEITKNEG